MSWLHRLFVESQIKDMPLPFATPTYDGGNFKIDSVMDLDVANKEKNKFTDISYLGSGSYGTVGDLGNGRVVKYTLEAYEALAARRMMKNGCPCVPRIYGVRTIQRDVLYRGEKSNIYAIEMEKVNLLSGSDYELYIGFRSYLLDIESENMVNGTKVNGTDVYDIYFKGDRFREFVEFHKCLIGCGLKVTDAHVGNVGRNSSGSLVLLDLGGSFGREFRWVGGYW